MWHETKFVMALFLDRRGQNIGLQLRGVRYHEFAVGLRTGLQIPVLEDLMGRKAATWWARIDIRDSDGVFEVHYSEPDPSQGTNRTLAAVHEGSPDFCGEILVLKTVGQGVVDMNEADIQFAVRASKATLDYWQEHPRTIPDDVIVIY